MILFDPITGEKRHITYEQLEGITGLEKHKLQQRKCRNQIIKCINCFIADDDTKDKKYRELMSKYKPKDEIWKAIREFDGFYISNYGRVKRNESFLITYTNNRIRRVTLKKENKSQTLHVHKLVADAFLYQPKNTEISHKDKNKYNCRAENLKFVTKKEVAIESGKNTTKRVAKIDPNTNEKIEVYESIMLAAKYNYTSRLNISKALRGEHKKAIGYLWRYEKAGI